jgi:hypothetical protein
MSHLGDTVVIHLEVLCKHYEGIPSDKPKLLVVDVSNWDRPKREAVLLPTTLRM